MFPRGCVPLDVRGSARFCRFFVTDWWHSQKAKKNTEKMEDELYGAEHTPPAARLLISARHVCKGTGTGHPPQLVIPPIPPPRESLAHSLVPSRGRGAKHECPASLTERQCPQRPRSGDCRLTNPA